MFSAFFLKGFFFPIDKPANGAKLGRYVFVARLEVCDLGVYLSGGVSAAR